MSVIFLTHSVITYHKSNYMRSHIIYPIYIIITSYLWTRFLDVSMTLLAVLPSLRARVLEVSNVLCLPEGDLRRSTNPFLANFLSSSNFILDCLLAALNATFISLVWNNGKYICHRYSFERLLMMKTIFASNQEILITFMGGIVTFGGLGGVSNERRKLTCFFCSVNWQWKLFFGLWMTF